MISLLIIGLLVFPVSFLSLADNNYLKYYHNWANAVALVAFALLTNASINRDTTYDDIASFLLATSLSMSITGTIVYWSFTNVEFWWMLYDGFNSLILIDEERIVTHVTPLNFAASVLVTIVPMVLLLSE